MQINQIQHPNQLWHVTMMVNCMRWLSTLAHAKVVSANEENVTFNQGSK